jgi:hypothetical protein
MEWAISEVGLSLPTIAVCYIVLFTFAAFCVKK